MANHARYAAIITCLVLCNTVMADDVAKQIAAFKKVQQFVLTHPSAVAVTVTGPGGKLNVDSSYPCGQSFKAADVLTNGVLIPLSAEIGTGPLSDTNVYVYTMYQVLTDPNGK